MAARVETAPALARAAGQDSKDRPSPLRWVLGEVSTTPGRLRAVAVALAAGLVIVGVVASATLRERRAAAVAVAEITEPALVHAAQLYVSLSDADATASRSFATGGVELSAQRDRYLKDIATAATELAALSETAAPTPAVRNDLQTIGIHLAEYAGTVETARTDNRQGYPVGAAYLRAASADLRATVLPAVLDIYKAEAERLDSAYGAATSAVALSRLVIFGGLLVAGFLVAQVWLARRTHRIFNPLLALATFVAVGLTLLPGVLLGQRTAELTAARHDGSDALVVLSSAQILAMRMRTDEILELVGRGTNRDAYWTDFKTVTVRLQGSDGYAGLVEMAPAVVRSDLAAYLVARDQVVRLETAGQLQDAVTVATSDTVAAPANPSETRLFETLTGELSNEIRSSQSRFARHIQAAAADLGTTDSIITLGVIVGTALVAAGMHRRLKEYR